MNILGIHITTDRRLRQTLRQRAYEAADKGRRTQAFRMARSTGANLEIAGGLVTLRNRSRHMVRNNGWAKRAVEAIVKHTIGDGIQPAPVGKLDDIKRVRTIWNEWAGSTQCDWTGKTNFYGLQELAMRAVVEGGDCIVIKRFAKPNNADALPLKLQLLEGDCIDHTVNGTNERGYAIMGVQFNKEGMLAGYWIYPHHPSETFVSIGTATQSNFVPAADVLHAFEILRIGQVRGIPFGVSAFMKMSDFGDYEDAQLMKQKVAACFAMFVSGSTPTNADEDKDRLVKIEPGTIEYLNEGEQIEFTAPSQPPSSDYDAYSARLLQGIAAAYGITYEMLTMDYSKVNFTSGRMAKIDVTQNFKSWQYNMIVPQICAPVWQWFCDSCVVAGKLQKAVPADWTAPRVQQLDPVKETTAQANRIRGGLSTISETIREMGREPEEFFNEYAQDVERIKKLGISIETLINTMNNEQLKMDN
jgi:lambda family phage portal protein